MEPGSKRSKIFELNDIKKQICIWKFFGKKIVFTNGCFDILHLGHLDYLSQAKSLGNILIIGLNTDNSIMRIKGKGRPVTDQNSRSQILTALRFVDAVIFFDEDTPYNLIKEIKPDILVKGSDYQNREIVGADIVEEYGGGVTTIDFLEGYSTSSIIEKIKKT
ncbi:MAG: D-glycero-beta-D-manno-heptose 1-phosphate adenylyltransferase [Bacteroidetes bacterium]|nr:D-glycero-beta-D-manno-heptose 1-phosphate adenylyltransferase [Bacteroidota bacterium]